MYPRKTFLEVGGILTPNPVVLRWIMSDDFIVHLMNGKSIADDIQWWQLCEENMQHSKIFVTNVQWLYSIDILNMYHAEVKTITYLSVHYLLIIGFYEYVCIYTWSMYVFTLGVFFYHRSQNGQTKKKFLFSGLVQKQKLNWRFYHV